jgi:protein phosphatase
VKIVIPDPSLVLLIGPSGAGKSTLATRHFKPTEILSSDAIRAALTDDPADQEASAEAFRVLAILANGRLRRRRMTVIDATNLRAADRKKYSAVASRYGIPTVAIAFDFPAATYDLHNRGRPDRVVDDGVLANQASRMRDTMADLPLERYVALHVFHMPSDADGVAVERMPDR